MRHRILGLCLGVFPACAAKDDIATVYDPCSPLTIVVPPDTSPAETLGVEGALAAWHRVLPTQIVVGAGSQAPDALPVRFVSGDTFYRAIYWDATGDISISREHLDPADYALALAHEMGHAFGLLHVAKTDRLSVMNVGNLVVEPTEEDAASVKAIWERCREPAPAE